MSELLNVVLDFNSDKISKLDFDKLFSSLLRFLNCFRMQSATNQFRIYVSFPNNSLLVFPLESTEKTIESDSSLSSRMAFQDLK
jgi:hypothetical protein